MEKLHQENNINNNQEENTELSQRTSERSAWNERMKKRLAENPVATDEEYDAGVYREGIESQVRDAVFALNRKGYKTFQSGFHEKKLRVQFVDMYNKHVVIPDFIFESFKDKSFEISIDYFDHRTTINITPIKKDEVLLDEWKTVWDEFATKMPPAEQEDFTDIKYSGLATDFRKYQDSLRDKAQK